MLGRLFFLISLPLAGKSSFADRWVKYQETIDGEDILTPRALVSDDDIRLALYDKRFNRKCESQNSTQRRNPARPIKAHFCWKVTRGWKNTL